MSLKITEDEARKFLLTKQIELVQYAGSCTGMSLVRCMKDGHEWLAKLHTLKNGKNRARGCPKCSNKAKVPIEDLNKDCAAVGIRLLKYGGSMRAKSKVQCLKCKRTWNMAFDRIRHRKQGCSHCKAKYKCDNLLFDSSWEVIFYKYQLLQGKRPQRLMNREKVLIYAYEGQQCRWYPDFIMDGKYYEIKPQRCYKRKPESITKSIAKAKAYPEVIWVRDKEIKEMSKVVGDVSQYKQI